MRGIQKYRFAVQFLCIILSMAAFFVNFKIFMLVLMGLTLLSGVFYCGWVCPYGLLQDVFSKLGLLLGIKKKKIPRYIQRILVVFRYIILVFVILITFDFIFTIMSFDPRVNFGNLLSGNIVSSGSIVIISLFALISLFFQRPFCNYLCYEGAKYGLMSSLRLFTIKRDKTICINCKKCDMVCPMNIELSTCNNLRSLQCINCFECISSCPVEGSLSYGKVPIIRKIKYTLVPFVLLSIFLGFMLYNNYLDRKDIKAFEKSLFGDSSATESLDATGIADGGYSGAGQGFKGLITVEVTIKAEQIIKIEVLNHSDNKKWFDRADSIIPHRIINAQSTDISLVSGATYSSAGIRDAVKNALKKARNH